MRFLLSLLLLVALASAQNGVFGLHSTPPLLLTSFAGVDISAAASQSAFACMASNGVQFAIIRAYRSSGSPDPNAANSLYNAQAAGISADVYMFPCPKCGDAAGQVDDMLQALGDAPYTNVWVDVEQESYWFVFIRTCSDTFSLHRSQDGPRFKSTIL